MGLKADTTPDFAPASHWLEIPSSWDTIRRIHIIGGPGSGKTSLARRLGARLALDVFVLDDIAFEGPRFTGRPLAVRLARVHEIAELPAWLTEGIHVGWTDELLRRSELIIWLDGVTWQTAVRRIVWRFGEGGLQEAKRQQGLKRVARFDDYARNLSLLVDAVRTTRRYYQSSVVTSRSGEWVPGRVVTQQCLAPFADKVLHVQTPGEINALLHHIDRVFGEKETT